MNFGYKINVDCVHQANGQRPEERKCTDFGGRQEKGKTKGREKKTLPEQHVKGV